MKKLIVCADGTWAKAAQTNPTNVVKFARAVATRDANQCEQIVYYHDGIGTRGSPWTRLLGGAIGAHLDENIKDVYLFLANNFEPGDEIWLVGFSRGAYTVRSAAGMIRNCGVLRRAHFDRYEQAYRLYRNRSQSSHPNEVIASEFRSKYSTHARIRFVGVWDTVGALGVPISGMNFWSKKRYQFHDVELSGSIDVAMQALAIDERRKPFDACVWTRTDPGKTPTQVLEQAWFPGVHGDVGGGYSESGLSDAALMWMIKGAQRTGLRFSDALELAPLATDPVHESMTLGYRLLGTKIRRIGACNPHGNEYLAQVTEERRQSTTYAPSNVEEFLEQCPDYGLLSAAAE